MTPEIEINFEQLDREITEIVKNLDTTIPFCFAHKEFYLDCRPSEIDGEEYYKAGTLDRLCVQCAYFCLKERQAFDMPGRYQVRSVRLATSGEFRYCTICQRALDTPVLVLDRLRCYLTMPNYINYPYPYPYILNSHIAYPFKVLLESCRYWLNPSRRGSLKQSANWMVIFVQRLQRVKAHWEIHPFSNLLNFEVQPKHGKVVLQVEADYNEGNQGSPPFDGDPLFVNQLCQILGIDTQEWRYRDHDRPHNEGR